MNKVFKVTTLVILCFAFLTVSALAFEDMPNDWSTVALQSAVDNGLLSGDGNLLKPRDTLTRAQMATVMTRAFGAKNTKDLSEFSDIPENAWYRDAMAKAYYMNIFRGDGAGHMNPEKPVTREEAFTVLARALNLDATLYEKALSRFDDTSSVSDWAKASVSAMVENGYVNGSNGLLNPKGSITRAEFAQVMYNLISLYVDSADDLEKLSFVKGNVVLRTNVGEIKALTFPKDLIIADGVEGELKLESVNVSSRLVVRSESKLSYSGKTFEIVSSVPTLVLTLDRGAEVEKLTLLGDVTVVDRRNETHTPTPPSTPSKPDTPDTPSTEDIWTDFH